MTQKHHFSSFTLLGSCLAVALVSAPLRADILTVTGPNSVPQNAPPVILSTPPPDVTDHCVSNQGQQGFNEKQQVTTTKAWSVDGGTIPQGTTYVNSHIIFLNAPDLPVISLSHSNVVWTFDFPIIGVMSDSNGNFEAASTPDFGAVGTNYTSFPTTCGSSAANDRVAPFPARGIEGADQYSVLGNTLTLSLNVAQPGDWVRVLTRGRNVQVDIKPGSYPNCFNINGNGVVPIAILGSQTLNVSNINSGSLNFNGLQVRVKPNNQNQCSIQDVNGDGIPDLVCQFQDSSAGWVQGSSVGVVTGVLNDGSSIRGTDSICIVP